MRTGSVRRAWAAMRNPRRRGGRGRNSGRPWAEGIGVGVGVGVALGAGAGEVWLGIGVGIAVGVGATRATLSAQRRRQ